MFGFDSQYVVSAMYHFVKVEDIEALQQKLLTFLTAHNIKGTLLVAHEGLNGTVAGTAEDIMALHTFLRADDRFKGLVTKESPADEMPFYRTKVKLKKEIVTMGVEDIDPTNIVGTYVKPADWNDLISDPDVIVVDTRNDYEVAIGTFKDALDPKTKTFREFPKFAQENITDKKQKVAMFCTGGIRCEKSTAYMKQLGFDEVYHLEGGILKYLEEVPQEESLWEGECFVFDGRVAVKHGLKQGKYDQCYACRMPLTQEEMARSEYEKGISCHHCHGEHTEEQRARHAERERQIQLAAERNEEHVGGDVMAIRQARREAKAQFREEQRKRNDEALQQS